VNRAGSAAEALLARGEEVVTGLLRENANRWETLSAADRARVERLARQVAQRLLHEPAVVLDAAERAGDETHARLARDLLGLGDQTARGVASAGTTTCTHTLLRPDVALP
jgi:glutamyl-tRNA reductase